MYSATLIVVSLLTWLGGSAVASPQRVNRSFCSAVDRAINGPLEERVATSFCAFYLQLSTIRTTRTITATRSVTSTATEIVTSTATTRVTSTTDSTSTKTVDENVLTTITGTITTTEVVATTTSYTSTQTDTTTFVATQSTTVTTTSTSTTRTPLTFCTERLVTTTTSTSTSSTTSTSTSTATATATILTDFAVLASFNEQFGTVHPWSQGNSGDGIYFSESDLASAATFSFQGTKLNYNGIYTNAYQPFSGSYFAVVNRGFAQFGYGIDCTLGPPTFSGDGCVLDCYIGGSGLFSAAYGNDVDNYGGAWGWQGNTDRFTVYAVGQTG